MHRLNSLQSSTPLHTRIAGVRHIVLRFDLLEFMLYHSTFGFDNLDVGNFIRAIG